MISERLKSIRIKQGLNKTEFAKDIGIPYTTYNNYETGQREPSSDFLKIISNKYDVSIDYIMGIKDDYEISKNHLLKTSERQLIEKYRQLDAYSKETVEYLIERELDRPEHLSEDIQGYQVINYYSDCRVSAGQGTITLDNPPTDTIKIPNIAKYKNANYAVMVTGDSMEPLYNDKDIVVVEITQAINIGEIGIFSHNSDSYIKKYEKQQLISLNPKHKPIDIDETTRCMGRVLGKV